MYRFLVAYTTIENAIFANISNANISIQKCPVLGLQNGPITKNRVLSLTSLNFFKI